MNDHVIVERLKKRIEETKHWQQDGYEYDISEELQKILGEEL